MLTSTERIALLRFARDTIAACLQAATQAWEQGQPEHQCDQVVGLHLRGVAIVERLQVAPERRHARERQHTVQWQPALATAQTGAPASPKIMPVL